MASFLFSFEFYYDLTGRKMEFLRVFRKQAEYNGGF